MADNPPIDPAQPRAALSAEIRRTESASERTVDVEQPTTIAELKAEDLPPDGGYGWVCVACNFFINGHTWGINSTYGVFLGYYLSTDYFPNTSALAYAFIGGLSISQAVMIAPLATHIIHLFGNKVCLHIGIFLETLGLLGASFSTQKYQIILAQGLCFGWGMGFLFTGSVGIIPQWFLKKRSVANAIAAAGSGFGAMTYSLAAGRAIQTLGLPWCFRILAICTFAVNMTAANLLRDRNKQTGSRFKAFDVGILKRPEFLLLQGWSWFSMLGYTVVVFSVPAYARTIGLSDSQSYVLNAILNVGQMVGRPLIGLSSDRYGRLNLACLYTLLAGVSIFVSWIPAEIAPSPYALLLFFSIVGGALAGTFWATIAPVSAEVVGLADLPAALSLTWVIMVPPTTVAEAIALEMRDQGKQRWVYLPPQIFTACMYVGGALCLWVLRGWKIGQLEEAERRLEREGRRKEGLQNGLEKTRSGDKTGAGGEIERVATQEEVRKVGWEWRDLGRRMMKWQNV
jgi:MFS family permease